MDFLVAGLGFGALLVLAGYAVREFGVFLFAPTRVRKQFAENVELAGAWRSLCRFGSNIAMIAGVATWIVLVVAVAFSVSDQTGSLLLAIAATAVSFAGAGAIYLASRRVHDPVAAGHTDTSAGSAGWHEVDETATENIEPVEGWKPRLLPKPTAVIVDDIPTWGAVYERPLIEEATVESSPLEEMPQAERLLADAPASVVASARAERPGQAIAGEADSTPEPVTELSESNSPDIDPGEQSQAVATAESESESEEEVAPAGAERAAETVADATIAESVPEVVEAEPEIAPVHELIAEEPAPDPAAMAAEVAASPRRFKSALLSNLDDPSSVDANAKFKSSILADLSSVRLPDDGPRFRSTTLIDLVKPDEEESDIAQSKGAPNRRN